MLSNQFIPQPKPNLTPPVIERPGMSKAPKRNWKISPMIWWGFLIIVAVIFVWKFAPAPAAKNFGLSLNADNYQAVFLTNGQVYFGQISSIDDSYVKLTNIYYLRLREALQSQGKLPADGTTVDQTQGEPTLVKFGTELHQPKDLMLINRSQILIIEELQPESKVAAAIADNIKKKSGK